MKKVLPIAFALVVLISCLAFLPMLGGAEHKEEPPPRETGVGTPISADIRPLTAATSGPGKLYLHIGSPIALSDGKILPLDSGNPGLTPILHMGRTLVPLRFVSEFFGADVGYDADTQTGIVKAGGKTAEFPTQQSYFVLDGTRIDLDTQTLNLDGRIMLPLRVLCEQVLGLSIDYRDSVILIAEKASLDKETVDEVRSKIGMYVKVSELETLTRYFEEAADNAYRWYDGDVIMEDAVTESAPMPSASPSETAPAAEAGTSPASDSAASSKGSDGDYSSTNIQVSGVDEGDIIKTDGRYIYLSCVSGVKIVSAADTMSLAAKIDIKDSYISDMYIDDGLLIVIGNESKSVRLENTKEYWTEYVFVNVYDTSDMTDIRLLREYQIEGSLTTSRKQGGYLYLLSTQYIWASNNIDDPRPLSGQRGKLAPLPVSDIMIAPGCSADAFMTLSAIDLRDSGKKVTSETMTVSGYGSIQYMSNSAMYIGSQDYYRGGGDNLSIAKFSIDGDKIGYAGSGTVRGSLNDQFSMDEYKGHLRVVTTDWGMGNNLFVLDGNMQICGSVEGFAPDERVYSARFMGDRGYVVTFRETDPLFVFDLKDPANPKITGELKVPGFSEYLHPVSENVILGIGRDVYDIYTKDKSGKEVVVGQRTGGIKLSLFDVSDMGKPRELDTLILGGDGYTELLYNHKAAMFKADESILAFCAEISNEIQGGKWFSGAFVISYAGDKLLERGRIEAASNYGITYGYSFSGQRLVYIGNTLYYAQNNVIRSFDLGTLVEKQSLKLG